MSALAERTTAPPRAPKSSVHPELTRSALPGWSYFIPNEHETVDAWRWPTCIETSEWMATDPQVAAIELAITLPPQRYRQSLDPNGMEDSWAALLADDLDVPILDARQPPGRSPLRFSMGEHVPRAIKMLRNGVQIFEIVGEIDDQGRWRLVDLQPIPLRTVTRPDIDRAGRLQAVWQWSASAMREIRIPADHLVVYTWGGDAGDPFGRSFLRPLHRPVILKDRLLRLDVVKHERNSMGIPYGTLPPGASAADRDLFEQLLADLGAGEQSNVVGPDGSRLALLGVTGTASDPIGSAEFHNKEMTRATAAMVLMAGDTGHGTYAAASEHGDVLAMAHDVIARRIARDLTVQLAARWALWNGVPPIARITAKPPRNDDEQPSGAPGETVPVAASGRRGTGSTRPRAGRSRRPVAAAAPVVNGRRLHRALNEHELAAAVDVAQLDTEWVSTRDELSAALLDVRAQLTTRAVEAIEEMGSVQVATLGDDVLALLAETEIDTDAIVQLLTAAAARGVAQVVGEARRQGADPAVPDIDYEVAAQGEAAGMVGRLRRAVADSAQSAAQTRATPGADASVVASAVDAHLTSLTSAQPDEAAAGATSRATHQGRAHALGAIPYRALYASELLDASTCGPCLDADGREYGSLEDAMAEYPGGGYALCEGGARCRGTLVGVFETEQEAAT